MDTRSKVKSCILAKMSDALSELEVDDLERGIYNWTIDFADEKHLVKNWKNNLFLKMYLEKARSVITNLDTDSYLQNNNLLKRLKEKEFLPHDICYMKPEHVFPERWEYTVGEYMKMFEYAYEEKKVATTDEFLCKKCHKRCCTYFSQQTRSADEPETIFVRCVNCGYQFRC